MMRYLNIFRGKPAIEVWLVFHLLTTIHRRILQHSPVRSIITWSWQDHLTSGLIVVT